jgi:Tol biopolymer transport system component/DNA-binding winged helix-turn-helix (wHTH) protein
MGDDTRSLSIRGIAGPFSIGDWHVEPSSRTLTGPDGDINLEPKVMQVLVLLAQHQGEVVTKEILLHAVWPDTFVGDEALSRAISELRRALGDDSKAPRFIQTIPKAGYRLIATVKHPEPPTAVMAGPPESVPVPQPTRWLTRVLWGTLILAGAGGTWLIARHGHNDQQPPMTVRPLVTLPGMSGVPSFSPDGTRIAFAWQSPQQASFRIVVKMVDDEPVQELTRPSDGSEDDSPAWSSDGRSIAFARRDTQVGADADGRSGIYVIPAIGGPERQVYSGPLCGGHPTWSPDGRTLVFSAYQQDQGKVCLLYRLSLDTREITRLVPSNTPNLGVGELDPVFSPDGKTIAFVDWVEAWNKDLYMIPSQGGTPKRLTFDQNTIWQPAWTSDGLNILFESSRGGSPELWRVAATGGQPERLSVGANATDGLALDREGRRLAYVVRSNHAHISALDLLNPGEPPVRIAESTRSEISPSYSSDGTRIAFASNRSGDAFDIWVAEANGANQTRLTTSSRGGNGSPRWSPDDQWIAYDSWVVDGLLDVYVIRASGGAPRRLTLDRSNEAGPTWSRDGRWLYFESDRTGTAQIFKMPSAGGTAVQITKGGGFPFPGAESADGRFLYYSQRAPQNGVWRVPIDGGLEEPVIPAYPAGPYYRLWALVEDGIYYLNTENETRPTVNFFRFATHRAERRLELPMSPCGFLGPDLAVSPNGRTLMTCFEAPPSSEIFMVENFR